MKKKIYTALAILVLAFVSLIDADTVFITPCDDMYTDVEHSTLPPTTDQLWVAEFQPAGHFERIMIKFDLDQLTEQTIESATLNLNRFMGCPQGGTTSTCFYAITEDWDEITWNPHIHAQYDNYVWASYGFNVNGWHSIDLTQLVQTWINNGSANYGLMIRAQTGSKFSKFYSKEHSNSNLHPYLEINYTVGINDENDIDIHEIFLKNYPNPFNPTTTISYQIQKTGNVNIEVYNILGQKITTLIDENQTNGEHSVVWNGTDNTGKSVSSGVYFYRLQKSRYTVTNKMILMK